jgi:hypothetical protein
VWGVGGGVRRSVLGEKKKKRKEKATMSL